MKKKEISLQFGNVDMLVIGFVVLLAVFIGILFEHGRKVGAEAGGMAVIYRNGEKVRELALEEDSELQLNYEYTNFIVVKEGAVSIRESDCPGKDCVHSGQISEKGQSIVCLPNRLEIRIEGESEVDFMLQYR